MTVTRSRTMERNSSSSSYCFNFHDPSDQIRFKTWKRKKISGEALESAAEDSIPMLMVFDVVVVVVVVLVVMTVI